jgi:hypothetical protein
VSVVKRREIMVKRSPQEIAALERCTQVDKLLRAIDVMEIAVKTLPPDQLLDEAIADFNRRADERSDAAGRDSDSSFLDRIQVNYVRHCLTSYDDAIRETVGKVGERAAVERLRERVYKAIAAVYPDLEQECDLQHEARARAGDEW